MCKREKLHTKLINGQFPGLRTFIVWVNLYFEVLKNPLRHALFLYNTGPTCIVST